MALALSGLLLSRTAAATPCGGSSEPRLVDLASESDVAVLAPDPADALTFRAGLATGDLDGDGVADLIVGASRGDGPDNARRDAGELHVLFGPFAAGAEVDLRSTSARRLVVHGARAGDNLASAATVGDVDGDGYVDLVIGAPLADGPEASRQSAGALYVLRGPLAAGEWDLGVSAADMLVHGARAGDRLGDSLASADVDGDGRADIVASAPGSDGPAGDRTSAGAALVVLGRSLASAVELDLGATAPDFAVHGESVGDALGVAVAAGDLTGDGIADLVVATTSSRGLGDARAQSGEVHVVFGPLGGGGMRDLAIGPADASVHGADDGDLLGQSMAVGAVGGGPIGDLVLGAPFASGLGNGRFRSGEVHVVFGPLSPGLRLDLATVPADVEVHGERAGDFLGWAVAAGDLDGDGVADAVATALGHDGVDSLRPSAGAAFALLGPLSSGLIVDLAVSTADLAVLGSAFGQQIGSALATGDVSGDSVGDVIVASRTATVADRTRPGAGLAHVVFGTSGGCVGELELVGVPEDATVACGAVPPPANVVVLDPCDPEPVLSFVEGTLPGACGNEQVLERTWTAENRCGARVVSTQRILVVDLAAPEVASSEADLHDLWPPNHRLVRFTIGDFAPTVVDACGGPTDWWFVDCASDQPDDGQGDGATEADCVVEDDGRAFSVRAERSGRTLAPRRYAVTIAAMDDCGNLSAPTRIGHVRVAHDRDEVRHPLASAALSGGRRSPQTIPTR